MFKTQKNNKLIWIATDINLNCCTLGVLSLIIICRQMSPSLPFQYSFLTCPSGSLISTSKLTVTGDLFHQILDNVFKHCKERDNCGMSGCANNKVFFIQEIMTTKRKALIQDIIFQLIYSWVEVSNTIKEKITLKFSGQIIKMIWSHLVP